MHRARAAAGPPHYQPLVAFAPAGHRPVPGVVCPTAAGLAEPGVPDRLPAVRREGCSRGAGGRCTFSRHWDAAGGLHGRACKPSRPRAFTPPRSRQVSCWANGPFSSRATRSSSRRSLPDGVRYFDYVPFSQVLHRSAALVHHGGIGTAAQGLAAGRPQLIMPTTFDQPDNARRLVGLGVARSLRPRAFRGAAVASASIPSSARRASAHGARTSRDGSDPTIRSREPAS